MGIIIAKLIPKWATSGMKIRLFPMQIIKSNDRINTGTIPKFKLLVKCSSHLKMIIKI